MSDLKVQLDVWGGEFHQTHMEEIICTSWAEVARITEERCEAGCLVNVLCLDFKTPAISQEALDRAMQELLIQTLIKT